MLKSVGSKLPTLFLLVFDSLNGLVYDADMSNGRIDSIFPRAAEAFGVGAFFFFTSREGVAVSLLK